MSKKEVKLKASILDLVGPLLKQLKEEVKSGDTETALHEIVEVESGDTETALHEIVEVESGDTETALHEIVEVESGDTETALHEIVKSIEKLKIFISVREGWETQLIGCIGQIERQIDRWTSESDVNNKEEIKRCIASKVTKLKDELNGLVQKAYKVPKEEYEKKNKNVRDVVEGEVSASSSNGEKDDVGFKELIECMKELNPQLRDCLYSLGIFPVNEKLKKRLLIYWWIGLGLVPLHGNKNRTAEQYAEILFDDLMDQGILIPDQTNKLWLNQTVKWCTIQPTIHKQLINACERKGLINSEKRKEGTVCFYGDDQVGNYNSDAKVNNGALLNFEQQYLDSEDIKKVLAKYHTPQVLQFGWWRYPPKVHKHDPEDEKAFTQKKVSEDHIEVDGIDFLNAVGQNVTYLSLRGISRVEELPKTIGKLEDLMILDIRACHNLEKLPEKPKSELGEILKPKLPNSFKSILKEAKWFKNLNHLDMSECYLLDHMPKWICELSNLEVLKGFVASSATRSKGQFCEVGDLSKLRKLRKLSIKMAKFSKDTIDLKSLGRLSVLTITWKLDDIPNVSSGSTSTSPKTGKISFPKNLEKLDIRCYPNTELSQLIDEPTSGLEKLKRLYIRGGYLTKLIDPDAAWRSSVEMLRLRSLNLLELSLTDLGEKCKLNCVEYLKCPKLEGFPEDETSYVFPRPSTTTQAKDVERQLEEPQISSRPGKKPMIYQPEKGIHTIQQDKLLADSIRAHQSQAAD